MHQGRLQFCLPTRYYTFVAQLDNGDVFFEGEYCALLACDNGHWPPWFTGAARPHFCLFRSPETVRSVCGLTRTMCECFGPGMLFVLSEFPPNSVVYAKLFRWTFLLACVCVCAHLIHLWFPKKKQFSQSCFLESKQHKHTDHVRTPYIAAAHARTPIAEHFKYSASGQC